MLRFGLAVAAAVAILDQASKWWILLDLLNPPRPIEVTSFFNLVLAWNRGVSFSLFDGGVPPWVFVALSLAIAAGLAVWLARAEGRLLAGALGLVIGGAVGNAADRLLHGAVVDFIQIHAGAYYWPTFNLADSAITIGVLIMVFDAFFGSGRSE